MPKDVGEIGKGFLDKNGALKSYEALARESEATSKNFFQRSCPKDSPSDSTFSSRTVSNALGAVRSRFAESANAEVAR